MNDLIKMDDLIKCGVCFNKFLPKVLDKVDKIPRLLDCGHTFCTKCIDDVKKTNQSSKVICPIDRSQMDYRVFPVNYQLMKALDKVCISDDCENIIQNNSITCDHCKFKICNECIPKHFDHFKTSLSQSLTSMKEKFLLLKSNSHELLNSLQIEIEMTRNFIQKSIPNLKGNFKESIKKEVSDFLLKIETYQQNLSKDLLIIDDKKDKCLELENELKAITIDNNGHITELHKINQKFKVISKCDLNDYKNDLNIENKNYNVTNPIAVNQNEWLKYYLDIANIDGKFDPEKFFESIQNDILGRNNKIKVAIGIIGRSGVGKSSFINAIFNLNPNDYNYINVDFVVVDTGPRLYEYENSKVENAQIWDTPGVGTLSFKIENHKKIIDQINCDIFVYLFETQFDQVDKQVVGMIRDMNKTVLICRTMIDNDYKRHIEKKEKKYYNKIPQQVRDEYLNPSSNKYVNLFKELKERYENDRIKNNLFLRDELVFYISNDILFRELFEFNQFLTKLSESLPKFQANIILGLVKTKSLEILKTKKNIIESEIDKFVNAYICFFTNLNGYKDWLNIQLQEYARRLGMNEIFKSLDDNEFNQLMTKVETEIKTKLPSIRNRDNNFASSADVDINLKATFSFLFRNFGSIDTLVKETIKFLKERLNILYERVSELFIAYLNNSIQ